jgi:hypothetical protein
VPYGITRNQYTSMAAAEKYQADQEKSLKKDMMTWAASTGVGNASVTLNDLSEAPAFAVRGDEARRVAQYHGIANADATPLTETEVEQLVQTAKNGNTEDRIRVFANVASLGGDMASAGFRQIGEKDSSLRYVGSLYQAEPAMAASVLRGRERLDADKTAGGVFEGNKAEEMFRGTLAPTLDKSMDPEVVNGIFQAAKARYIDKFGTTQAFDRDQFKQAMQDVSGTVANVAGGKMILPDGVDERTMNRAVLRATVEDYTAMSKTGSPPRHGNGAVVQPREIANQATFASVGNDEYVIRFPDATFAVVPGPDGQIHKYVMKADPARIEDMSRRDAPGGGLRERTGRSNTFRGFLPNAQD